MAWHWGSDPHAAAGHYIEETGFRRGIEVRCPLGCKRGFFTIRRDGMWHCSRCGFMASSDWLIGAGKLHEMRGDRNDMSRVQNRQKLSERKAGEEWASRVDVSHVR